MAQNTKLELTWIGKYDEKPGIEPRILIEDPRYSYGDAGEGVLPNGKPWSGNMLIHGDNLLALRALEDTYSGCVKCIYIDPPYNTGNAFEHYDDGLEHSIWLSLMRDRLVVLRNLLTEDGSIWISIDSDESHYLKVLCDEIFGRRNFIDEIVWQRAYAPVNLKKTLSRSHDIILVYAKNKTDGFELNRLPRTSEANDRYKNPDNDPRGVWKSSDCTVGPVVEEKLYTITTPSGRKVTPPSGRCWLFTEVRFKEMCDDNRIWFGPDGNSVPSVKKFLSEVKDGIVAQTLWTYQEVGHNQDAKKEIKALNFETVFDTPKPEKLIERVLTLGSNPGDLVLDSFLGSGTTSAVAQKMRRRYIGIELGEHAYTHCFIRMKKVCNGEDTGGVTKSQQWNGGGGFKFYELAPSLLKKDTHGHLVINKEYNADMLAAAMAKMEGFTYEPSTETFWKQGHSSETDFIYTTTQFVTVESLGAILDTMADGESLLVCCKAFQPECKNFSSRISVKKIPSVLLGRCEFDHDDYSLNIIELPQTEEIDDSEDQDNSPESFSDNTSSEPSLF